MVVTTVKCQVHDAFYAAQTACQEIVIVRRSIE
jgi:hypothetical protein